MDNDYKDLKKILGIDPLEITILKCGTFKQFEERTGRKIRRINPSSYDISDLLRIQECDYRYRGRGGAF